MVRVVASKDKRIPVGYDIAAINGRTIDDFLEFQFYNDVSRTRRILMEANGTSRLIVYRPHQNIAIELESPRYRQCKNKCDFCFINGLPKNLRKELYFRDDDYRLSFLFGNFLSLTNIDQNDITRIARLRLSPLYVSVHTTDPKLRIKLFKNKAAGDIVKRLKRLIDGDVQIHCQIVVIPGTTDGQSLTRTINDLSRLYPGVNSIGIVPVGKTKHLSGIPLVPNKMARSIIEFGQELNKRFRQRNKKGFVYLADEFFLKAGHQIPAREYYDELPQYENGIGMARVFLDEIASIKKVKRTRGRFLILTGKSASPFMKLLKARLHPDTIVDVKTVNNNFFGSTVTVSGLLASRDMQKSIRGSSTAYDRIFLPPDCANEQGQFIDGGMIEDRRVLIAPARIKEFLKCLQ